MTISVQDDRLTGTRIFTIALTIKDAELAQSQGLTAKSGLLPSDALYNLYQIAKADEQAKLDAGGRLPE